MHLFPKIAIKNFASSNFYKNYRLKCFFLLNYDINYELFFSNIHLSFLIMLIAL